MDFSPSFQRIKDKIKSWSSLKAIVDEWKNSGEKIVFTNGCFDLLHYGHVHYLAEASDLGDKLVVGLNSGDSVSLLKGSHRPINDELTRSHVLASLQFIDAITFFEEETPFSLIQLIMPHVLVKGGDWQPAQIVGSDIVLRNNGVVKSLPFVEGYSTTKIEQKIRSW